MRVRCGEVSVWYGDEGVVWCGVPMWYFNIDSSTEQDAFSALQWEFDPKETLPEWGRKIRDDFYLELGCTWGVHVGDMGANTR